MSIKRYTANKDNTISSAFKVNLSSRATDSNMGSSDILEMFAIYAQAGSSSLEQSRILVEFPVSQLLEDRTAGRLPESGSVTFKLKMFNAEHNQTVPENVTVSVHPIVKPWSEGGGLDMESYLDEGSSNWNSASLGVPWITAGGDYLSSSYMASSPIEMSYSQYLDTGLEDLDIDITPLVEEFLTNQAGNSTPASGSIVFNTTNAPTSGDKFKIYAYNGDYNIFQFSNVTGSSGKTHFVMVAGNASQSAKNFIDTINVSSSIKDYVAVTGTDNDLTASFTQRVSTFYGNTVISSSAAANVATVTNFAGGTGALNYGVLVKLSGSLEDGTNSRSYYTKKFFARSSHHGLERPVIEAQWNSAIRDDRGYIIKSSSLAPAEDNVNNIYLYNKIRGNFRDIPDTVQATSVTGSHLLVQLVPSLGSTPVTASGRVLSVLPANNTVQFSSGSSTYLAAQKNSTGIYNAQFAYGGAETSLYDVWTKRTISGASKIDLNQENVGTSGNTTANFSGVSNVTGDTSAFESGSASVRATLTIRITGIPGNNNVFTLTDAGSNSKTFIFKTDSDTFNDAGNLDSGRFIIGIQSATTPYAISQRLSTAITTDLEIESSFAGLDTSTDVYTQLYTGSAFTINTDASDSHYSNPQYLTKITNLKSSYKSDEQATFRVYTRNRNWQPNLYTTATSKAPVDTIRDAFYKLTRVADNRTVIQYSTGSTPSYSSLSYDMSGSYFDLDMSILEPNYLYEISFLWKDDLNYIEQKEKFKFRVDP